jgi:hypothetical protein
MVLEARGRIGGRVHTVDVGGVRADAGGAWLQQRSVNPLVARAHELGLHLVPTDFGAPLSGAYDGDVGDIDAALGRIVEAARGVSADRALTDVLDPLLASLDPASRRAATRAIDAEIVLEAGAEPAALSAHWALREPGTGDGDQWIVEGYGAIASDVARGLDIRLETPVAAIRYSEETVTVVTETDQIDADRCVCTVPLSLLAAGVPAFDPPLPDRHRDALSRLGMGRVEKVILRFDDRWWPHSPSGYMRWYDDEPSWGEWLDLTEGAGSPTVAGLIAANAIDRWHRGRPDGEVAVLATEALARWAAAVRRR